VEAPGFQHTLNQVPVAQQQLMNVNIFVQAALPSSSPSPDVKYHTSNFQDANIIRPSLSKKHPPVTPLEKNLVLSEVAPIRDSIYPRACFSSSSIV
jgi:hypothetical protein